MGVLSINCHELRQFVLTVLIRSTEMPTGGVQTAMSLVASPAGAGLPLCRPNTRWAAGTGGAQRTSRVP